MTIRQVRDDEVAGLSRLTVDAYTGVMPGVLPDDYLAELADVRGRAGEALVLVAVDDGDTVLGGITYVGRPGRWASLEGSHHAELRMLAVTPTAERRGVGAALVQACVERARLDGKRHLTLHTTTFMPTAQRLYERIGFRRHPERDLTLEDGMVLLGYALDIDG